MAVSDEIKEQTSKFKYMTKEQKKDYIWTYYKWWIIGAIVAVIAIFSLTKTIIKNSRPVFLDVVFLNTDYLGNSEGSPIENDFMTYKGANSDEYNFYIDYTSYMDNNYGNQKSMASQVKLVSMYSNQEVDICCGPEHVMTEAADVGGYYDFAEVFTEDELKKFEDAGYELFYYTEKEPEEGSSYNQGDSYELKTYVGGIYIDNCDSLINKYKVYSKEIFEKEKENGRYILTIAFNTTRIENAKDFVYFITGIN